MPRRGHSGQHRSEKSSTEIPSQKRSAQLPRNRRRAACDMEPADPGAPSSPRGRQRAVPSGHDRERPVRQGEQASPTNTLTNKSQWEDGRAMRAGPCGRRWVGNSVEPWP
jgi:hypothetical protein